MRLVRTHDPPAADQLHAELGAGGGRRAADDRRAIWSRRSCGARASGAGRRPPTALAERSTATASSSRRRGATGRFRCRWCSRRSGCCRSAPSQPARTGRACCRRSGAPLVAVPVLHALLCAVMLLLHGWAVDPADGAWQAFVWGPPLVAARLRPHDRRADRHDGPAVHRGVREWWSRLGAWLGIYATAWMVIAVAAVYGPHWVRLAIEQHPWTSLTAGGGWLGTVVAGLFAGKSDATGGDSAEEPAHEGERSGGRGRAVPVHRRPADRRRLRAATRSIADQRAASTGPALGPARWATPLARAVPARVAGGAGGVPRGAAADGGARGHQRVQPQRLLPQPAGALLSRRDALRAGRAQPAEFHRLRRRRRSPAGRSRRAGRRRRRARCTSSTAR